ncbi:MAG TPA: YcxB family protein [Actinomycetota bacterium]|nr:YcxB family protein [Actinomycetota bacterium]
MTTSETLNKPMSVAVDYRFSLRSFIKATHASWRSQTVFQVLAAMMVILALASVFVIARGASIQDQAPVFAYMILATAFYFVYPVVAFSSDPRHRMGLSFEFTRDAFRFRRGETESTLPWSAIKAAVETGDFYVLDLPDKQKVAVPQSAFGVGEEQRFRLLAATSGVPIH